MQRRDSPASPEIPPGIKTDHDIITTSAGWAYRTNDRGWTIYCNPKTRRWHTRAEALAIIRSQPQLVLRTVARGRSEA